jgi:hypothetical protein
MRCAIFILVQFQRVSGDIQESVLQTGSFNNISIQSPIYKLLSEIVILKLNL